MIGLRVLLFEQFFNAIVIYMKFYTLQLEILNDFQCNILYWYGIALIWNCKLLCIKKWKKYTGLVFSYLVLH